MSGLDHKGRLRELGQIPPSYKDESLALAFVALEAQYYAYEQEVAAAAQPFLCMYLSIYQCMHTHVHTYPHSRAHFLAFSISLDRGGNRG